MLFNGAADGTDEEDKDQEGCDTGNDQGEIGLLKDLHLALFLASGISLTGNLGGIFHGVFGYEAGGGFAAELGHSFFVHFIHGMVLPFIMIVSTIILASSRKCKTNPSQHHKNPEEICWFLHDFPSCRENGPEFAAKNGGDTTVFLAK